jgi:hypothetical protein
MRNIIKLAVSMTLLATQVNVPQVNFGNVAAAAQPSATVAGVYEVKLNMNTASPVTIVAPTKPDYNTDVLAPLRAAQATEAADAVEAARARVAAEAAARARLRRAVVLVAALVPGSHTDWMAAAGIASSDYGYVDYIIGHESGWGVTKSNRAGSGAYGLGQALPATKMARFGSDYLTNPVTQLQWANAYAVGKYGSWANAYSHWLARHSW